MANVFSAIGRGIKTGVKRLANIEGDDKPKFKLPDLSPSLDSSADAPPPPNAKLPEPTTPLEHASRVRRTAPEAPKLIDPKAELGDAPIREIEKLPDLPTRAPLTKEQKTGVKNRGKGAWEGLQNAAMHGASGPAMIGAMISGALNRETPNRMLFEQRELLPAVQVRNARVREISGAQRAYNEGRRTVEDANDRKVKQYDSEFDRYKWAEDLNAKALENEASRKAKANEADTAAKRRADEAAQKHRNALEMRDRWEKHNAEQKELDRKNRLTMQQMQANEAMRREKFRADNNLERDFYRYTAEGGSESEPSEEDIKRDMEGAASVGMPITREQAVEQVKKRLPKPSKPGASKAAQAIAQKYGGSWGNVPAGK